MATSDLLDVPVCKVEELKINELVIISPLEINCPYPVVLSVSQEEVGSIW